MPIIVLLIVWPLAELFVAILVANVIGVPLTVLALIAGWPLGAWLMRAEGRAAWRRLAGAVAAGRPPGGEVVDGALILAGGALLIIPGFITDVVGLVLLAPTRALVRASIERNVRGRMVVAVTRFGRRPRGAYDADATASDLDRPRLGL